MHEPQKNQRSPRWTVILISLLPVLPIVGLLAMRYNQPKWLSPMTGPDELLIGGVLTLLLGVAGLLWMISTLRIVGEEERWSWWITVAPTVVLAGALLYLTLPT
ncbi:MAG: hypothetical protein K0Q46_6208 [Rhodococcus erythropolis]|jgi:hypothetical protein|nr:hypothetical protein [Rhodococcus erythropolis]